MPGVERNQIEINTVAYQRAKAFKEYAERKRGREFQKRII